jgi:hypothetical protein
VLPADLTSAADLVRAHLAAYEARVERVTYLSIDPRAPAPLETQNVLPKS